MLCCLVSAVLAQAPVATAPGAPPAAAPGETISGNVSLGAIILRGNSDTTSFAFGSAAQRKSATWISAYKLSAAYGRSTDPTAKGWSLVYETPAPLVEFKVPFVLENIPLP